MNKDILTNDWAPLFAGEFNKDYYTELRDFLKKEYAAATVYPEMHDIFNALHHTPFQQVKIVILGQDPYHGPGQAHGFSFSVKCGVSVPPSLRNIFKEMQDDVGIAFPTHGNLISWANQGVLLLNTVLTVRQGQANAHKGRGWEIFTDKVIQSLNQKKTPVVYLLWGAAAQRKQALIDTNKHFIITSPHPSPLSAYRGFFGSKPFSRANRILQEHGMKKVDWRLRECE